MIILSPFHSVCLSYGLNVCSKTSYVEGLALVAIFGHGASKEIIQIKWSHKGWESPDPIGYCIIRRDTREFALFLSIPYEGAMKNQASASQEETSPETDPTVP